MLEQGGIYNRKILSSMLGVSIDGNIVKYDNDCLLFIRPKIDFSWAGIDCINIRVSAQGEDMLSSNHFYIFLQEENDSWKYLDKGNRNGCFPLVRWSDSNFRNIL